MAETRIRPGAVRADRPWLRMFAIGLALWLISVITTFVTGNPNLIPTVVLLGSFLVPTPHGWLVQPTAAQVRDLPIFEWSGLAVISLIGIAWLTAEWRLARRRSGPPPPRIAFQLPIR